MGGDELVTVRGGERIRPGSCHWPGPKVHGGLNDQLELPELARLSLGFEPVKHEGRVEGCTADVAALQRALEGEQVCRSHLVRQAHMVWRPGCCVRGEAARQCDEHYEHERELERERPCHFFPPCGCGDEPCGSSGSRTSTARCHAPSTARRWSTRYVPRSNRASVGSVSTVTR